jgi:hypothetical protein
MTLSVRVLIQIFIISGLIGVSVTLLLLHTSLQSKEEKIFDTNGCSKGWDITGYFTPVENDYSGPIQTLQIISNSQIEERTFFKAFLDDVNVEGWGKTLQGDYIHPDPDNYKWYSAPIAKDALNNKLAEGKTVAVDPDIIEFRTNLAIPTLKEPWNSFTYIALDIGGGVKGKHVDIYTGEGKNAKEETFRLTSNDDDNKVCRV